MSAHYLFTVAHRRVVSACEVNERQYHMQNVFHFHFHFNRRFFVCPDPALSLLLACVDLEVFADIDDRRTGFSWPMSL